MRFQPVPDELEDPGGQEPLPHQGPGAVVAVAGLGLPGKAEKPVVVQEMVGEGLGQGFLLMPGLGAADVGDDDAAADHPGQAPKAVVHQVPLVDALAGFFDVHLPFPEKPDAPAAHVVPGLVGKPRQVVLGRVVLARRHGKEFTHGLTPPAEVKHLRFYE